MQNFFNPWVHLPQSSPYILRKDKPILEKYNEVLTGNMRLRFETVPVPYVGNPFTAKILLLALNPGFKEEDIRIVKSQKDLLDADIKNLTFENRVGFYFLDQAFNYSGGYKWWYRRMRQLIEQCSIDAVSNSVACVQYFPYHSIAYKSIGELIPSQSFTFYLVREAIKQKKLIVFLRSKSLWIKQIPELMEYPFIEMKAPRNPYFSNRNLSEGDFKRIIDTINN